MLWMLSAEGVCGAWLGGWELVRECGALGRRGRFAFGKLSVFALLWAGYGGPSRSTKPKEASRHVPAPTPRQSTTQPTHAPYTPTTPTRPYTRTPTAPAHIRVHPPHPLQRFWEGPLDEYRYVPAHEIADAYYRTEPGAAIMRELEAPPEELEKGGHSELATNR